MIWDTCSWNCSRRALWFYYSSDCVCLQIATQEVSSWDVGTNGRKERKLATRKLQEGWEEYDRKFDEHLKRWMASELTQEQLSQQIMATAAQLRAQSCGQWNSEVKGKIPELLAGIFALYAILRSGKAYSSMLASATSETAEKSDAVEPEECLSWMGFMNRGGVKVSVHIHA